MSIGRMSVVHDADRYFTIAVDECSEWGIKGVMFHGNSSHGIYFYSLLEMILHMDRVFDRIGSPRQTFQMRCFPGAEMPAFSGRKCEEPPREGKVATFFIYVKYRYHATLQGTLTWQEEEQSHGFESEIQLILLFNQILSGRLPEKQDGISINACQMAFYIYDAGRLVKNYQYIPARMIEKLDVPVYFGIALENFIWDGITEEETLKYGLHYGELISREASFLSGKSGRKATFSIKVMFQEYSTWQGLIYWREGRVQMPFRSFKEVLHMIVSAAAATAKADHEEDRLFEEEMQAIHMES